MTGLGVLIPELRGRMAAAGVLAVTVGGASDMEDGATADIEVEMRVDIKDEAKVNTAVETEDTVDAMREDMLNAEVDIVAGAVAEVDSELLLNQNIRAWVLV